MIVKKLRPQKESAAAKNELDKYHTVSHSKVFLKNSCSEVFVAFSSQQIKQAK